MQESQEIAIYKKFGIFAKADASIGDILSNSLVSIMLYSDRLIIQSGTGKDHKFVIPLSSISEMLLYGSSISFFKILRITYTDEKGQVVKAGIMPYKYNVIFRFIYDSPNLLALIEQQKKQIQNGNPQGN